jgi:hypothetical protein
MKYNYSKHSVEQMKRRGISHSLVEEVLHDSTNFRMQDDCVKIFQKIIDDNKNIYFYRVFVNICKTPPVIITVYKTSKVEKYEN